MKYSNYIKENRIGKFKIDYRVLRRAGEPTIIAIMEDMIIVKCNLIDDHYEYTAYNPSFEKVEFNKVAPEYILDIEYTELDNDSIRIDSAYFKKLDV